MSISITGIFSDSPAHQNVQGRNYEAIFPRSLTTRTISIPRLGRWSLRSLLVVGSGALLVMLLVTTGTSHIRTSDYTTLSTFRKPIQRRLRLIIPADEPGVNLCKTLLSGYANGFPASIIVNWGREFSKGDDGGFGMSHIGKIDGALEAIQALTSPEMPKDERLSDDDLILILDAYDVWLQAPPELLIRRYYAQLAAADDRIAKSWGASAPGTAPVPRQKIILSSQKRCWPTERDGHATKCDILPESNARPDLYGPDTDKDYVHHLHDMRPRYINSGSMIGPAGAVRRYLQTALKMADDAAAAGNPIWTDQGILGTILGAQEAWRKQEREINTRALMGESVASVRREWNASYDYGIGLDYIQDMFKPTVFEEEDGEYMTLSDMVLVANKSTMAGVDPPRIQGLPKDMIILPGPLEAAGLRAPGHLDGKRNPSWADVSLYTDFWSEVVAVAVHHNAHRNGMKSLRLREWWPQTWFFPYLREIVEVSVKPRPLRALAEIEVEGTKLQFWAPAADALKPMTRLFNKEALSEGMEEFDWQTLCSKAPEDNWWDHIFQDGNGWGAKKSGDV